MSVRAAEFLTARLCGIGFYDGGFPTGQGFLSRGEIMRPLAESIRRFLVSEEGPTAVEYAVMLAMIILVCIGAIQGLGSATNSTFSDVSAKMSGS